MLQKLKIFWNLNNKNQSKLTNVLNYQQWKKLNYLRWYLWMIPMTILAIILSTITAILLPDLVILSATIWLLPISLGIIFVLFGLNGKGFITYLSLKYNDRYPKNITNGSSFFLQDVRWPWKAETDWYDNGIQRYFHLPEADWIITSKKLDKITDADKQKYFNELKHIFTFNVKESMYDKEALLGLWVLLKRLSSINEILSATMSYTDKKLAISEKEFISLVNNLIDKNQKTHPLVLTEHLPKMPNALNSTPSGGGKTTSVVYPQLIANATANIKGNMFITDPKGELLENTGNWLRIMGYDVYSFNLKDLHKSQGWNPFSDVYEDVLIRGYLSQILASYQKHNIDFYSQYSIIYNKDIATEKVLSVADMVNKVLNHKEYNAKMFKVYTDYNQELIEISQNAKCYIHNDEAFIKCSCLKNNDLYVDYGNTIYAGIEKILLLYRTIIPSLITTKVNQITNALMNPDGKKGGGDNAFWDENAKNLFQGAIWLMLEKKELNVFSNEINKDNLNLFTLYKLVLDKQNYNPNAFGKDYKQGEGSSSSIKEGWLNNLSDSDKDNYLKLYQTTRNSYTTASKSIEQPDKTRTIIEGVVAQHLVALTNEGAKYATSFSELDFNEIVKSSKPFAIFMAVDLNDTTYHKLGILFISMLYQKLIWWAEQNEGRKLPRPFMFLLDEAGNLPAIPNLGKILSLSRSYRVMMLIIIQSLDQLKKSYKDDVDTIIDNCKYKIIRGADEYNTAKRWSDTIGNTSIKDDNKNYSQQRPLITPDEIMDLDFAQRHQCLFFTTIFNPDSKLEYEDKAKKKPKWLEVSQQAGNYKFIQKQNPWYITYNPKLFNKLGAIAVETKNYIETERVIDFDKLKLLTKPEMINITNEETLETLEEEMNYNNIIEIALENDNSFDVNKDIDETQYSFNDKEIKTTNKTPKEKEEIKDYDLYVDNFQEQYNIISDEEFKELDMETQAGFTNMSFNDYFKHFKSSSENELLKNIHIVDRNETTLINDLIKMFKNEYKIFTDNNIFKMLNRFSTNINLKRFVLLIKNLMEVNNIYIDEKEFIGTSQHQNVLFINQIINKIMVWLLYGKNDFSSNNLFDRQINSFISKTELERTKINDNTRNINEMIEVIINYLKTEQGNEFRKQFIIKHTTEFNLEESWEEYWNVDFENKAKSFSPAWRNYLLILIKNK